MVRKSVWALFLIALGATAARAQTVQTDPLQCWWRTSTGAVRIGEPFTVVLTCAVLETDEVTVVPDQTRLEPSVVQFAPFEVLGGSHGADLRSDQRRFFQYDRGVERTEVRSCRSEDTQTVTRRSSAPPRLRARRDVC